MQQKFREYSSSPRITEQIKLFLAQPRINIQSFKSTPDSTRVKTVLTTVVGCPPDYHLIVDIFSVVDIDIDVAAIAAVVVIALITVPSYTDRFNFI